MDLLLIRYISARRERMLYIAHGNILLQLEDPVMVFAADEC